MNTIINQLIKRLSDLEREACAIRNELVNLATVESAEVDKSAEVDNVVELFLSETYRPINSSKRSFKAIPKVLRAEGVIPWSYIQKGLTSNRKIGSTQVLKDSIQRLLDKKVLIEVDSIIYGYEGKAYRWQGKARPASDPRTPLETGSGFVIPPKTIGQNLDSNTKHKTKRSSGEYHLLMCSKIALNFARKFIDEMPHESERVTPKDAEVVEPFPFHKMNVGMSFLIPTSNQEEISAAMEEMSLLDLPNRKFKMIELDDKGLVEFARVY